MVNFSKLVCLPRRLDPDQARLVTDKTRKLYQTALDNFVEWLTKHSKNPASPGEIDCMFVEYKNQTMLARHKLSYTIAALEFFFPQLRRELVWARRVAEGTIVAHHTQHTVPITSLVTSFYGCSMASAGRPSLGLGMILQQLVGLRPKELLKLRKRDVMTPDFGNGQFIFRLGAGTGTKSKREQAAMLDPSIFPQTALALTQLMALKEDDEYLFDYSYYQYHESIQGISDHYGIRFKVTPHSGRAGFATERVAQGEPADKVRSAGRWLSESSFRTYLDVVMASQVSVLMSMAVHKEAMIFTAANLALYLNPSTFSAELHAASGVRARSCFRALRASGPGAPRSRAPAADAEGKEIKGRFASASKGKGFVSGGVSAPAARGGRGSDSRSGAKGKGRGESGSAKLKQR
jgi:integrase